MAERLVGQDFLQQKIPRRRFNSGAIKAGGLLSLVVLSKGFVFNEEKFGYFENVDPETSAELLKFSPITIAHRGGNSSDYLRKSISCGVALIEADVQSEGGFLAVGHEEYLGPFVVDNERKSLRLGGPSFSFDNLAILASSVNQGMFLDLKEIDKKSFGDIQKVTARYGIEETTFYSSKNWELLDDVGQLPERKNRSFYTIDNGEKLEKFLEEQEQKQRLGVSLDTHLANSESVTALKNSKAVVFVYVVSNPKKALELLQAGVDGLISNNLSLLGVFSKHPTDQLAF